MAPHSIVVAVSLLITTLIGPASIARAERDVFEVFSEDGTIARVSLPRQQHQPVPAGDIAQAAGDVVPLHVSGPSGNRFDIVIVGDGYTQDELPLFHEHAADKWEAIRTTEPFATYANYFNVWLVDVVSNESGVDNDPTPGVMKDTPLDMQFWCGGTERLLCMNEAEADRYADLAPDADQVLGLANSTKYGGAGGVYATSSGGNQLAAQITLHELGHSIGDLADEYDYTYRLGLEDRAEDDVRLIGPYIVYAGGEPSEYNVSPLTHDEMQAAQAKWWRWLGESSPDGSVVSTYEGAHQHKLRIYRPTDASLMRVLGKPFNLPSREQMTAAFYERIKPIDAAPATDIPLNGSNPVTIQVLQPQTHDLAIDWFLDGEEILAAHDETTFVFPDGSASELMVRVSDPTAFVRDPAWQATLLTQELTWTIAG